MGLQVLEWAEKRGPQPEQAGKPWTEEEENRLTGEFNEEKSPAEIAKAHRRSRGAVRTRLVSLDLLQA